MIDFGLAGLFERFDNAFGKRLTWWLTVLIGLAIAGTCLSLIASAVTALYSFVSDALISGDGSREALNVLAIVGLCILGALVTANIVNGLALRKLTKQAEEMQDTISASLTNAEKVSADTQKRLNRTEDAMAMVNHIVDSIEELHVEIKDKDKKPEARKGSGSGTPR